MIITCQINRKATGRVREKKSEREREREREKRERERERERERREREREPRDVHFFYLRSISIIKSSLISF